MAEILSSTNWQGTKVYDKDNNDLTKENANFIGCEIRCLKLVDMNFSMLKQVIVGR